MKNEMAIDKDAYIFRPLKQQWSRMIRQVGKCLLIFFVTELLMPHLLYSSGTTPRDPWALAICLVRNASWCLIFSAG